MDAVELLAHRKPGLGLVDELASGDHRDVHPSPAKILRQVRQHLAGSGMIGIKETIDEQDSHAPRQWTTC